jgi:D-glycero-D-manno-heptose 1,7-bisphosphate phosphatase
LPNVPAAIQLIREKGYLVIVVTNQSGVARGYFTTDDVERLNEYMRAELQKHNADIDAIYYCPHLPTGIVARYAIVCRCRKPGTLLFERAVSEFDVDVRNSYAVGDRLRDLEPGKKLGVRTALISEDQCDGKIADAVYSSLLAFALDLP